MSAGSASSTWVATVRGGRKVTGPTEAVVWQRLRELRRDNLTVGAFLLDWLEREVPKFARSVNTVGHYEWAVRKHLEPALGKHRLARLTADHVDELLEARAESGLAQRTVARIRGTLVTALEHAVRRELVPKNVAKLTRTPAGPVAERRSLTPAEAKALMAAVAGDRLEALVIVGVTMGLRPGELLGLAWWGVDVTAGVIHVRQALLRERNRPVLGELKTERSRRSLECPSVVVEALRRRREVQRLERAASGPDWSDEWEREQLVFTTTNGTPIDASNLRRYFHRACQRAGIGRWTPYEMRHSAASLLSHEGVPLELVADTLGHDGTRMAREVYRHAIAPTVTAAAEPMQRLFGQPAREPHGQVPGSPDGAPGHVDGVGTKE